MISLGACAQITGVENKNHRTLASCAGTFRAIGQVATTAQPALADISQFVKKAIVFRDALRTVNPSLPQAEQDNLATLERRAFEQGLVTWDGVTGQDASDLTVFNRLEYRRIEQRCEAALSG